MERSGSSVRGEVGGRVKGGRGCPLGRRRGAASGRCGPPARAGERNLCSDSLSGSTRTAQHRQGASCLESFRSHFPALVVWAAGLYALAALALAFVEGGGLWSRVLLILLNPFCIAGFLSLDRTPRITRTTVFAVAGLQVVTLAADICLGVLAAGGSGEVEWWVFACLAAIPAAGLVLHAEVCRDAFRTAFPLTPVGRAAESRSIGPSVRPARAGGGRGRGPGEGLQARPRRPTPGGRATAAALRPSRVRSPSVASQPASSLSKARKTRGQPRRPEATRSTPWVPRAAQEGRPPSGKEEPVKDALRPRLTHEGEGPSLPSPSTGLGPGRAWNRGFMRRSPGPGPSASGRGRQPAPYSIRGRGRRPCRRTAPLPAP